MARQRDPSFQVLLTEMRSRDALKAEGAFHALLPLANERIEELIKAFEIEKLQGVRCWLLELIGEARAEQAFDVLRKNALSEDEALRGWGISGLQKLGTPPARAFLWEHGLPRDGSD
ncbi:MAG: HEAT repeat domain-containing protein [Phycisphaerales bacterium]|nr:HEAT repeat domain-containing protein [Hyphomonadaceae bacterium]